MSITVGDRVKVVAYPDEALIGHTGTVVLSEPDMYIEVAMDAGVESIEEVDGNWLFTDDELKVL